MGGVVDIFNAGIADKINRAMGSLLLSATLIKTTYAEDATDLTKNVETVTSYSAKGFVEIKDVRTRPGTQVINNARVVSLLGASIQSGVVPIPGDKVTIEGVTSTIIGDGVSRDPAGALFTCITQ